MPVSLFLLVVGVKVNGKGGEEACSAGEGGDRSNGNKSGSITEGEGIRAGGSGGMNGGSCSGGGGCVDGGGCVRGGIMSSMSWNDGTRLSRIGGRLSPHTASDSLITSRQS